MNGATIAQGRPCAIVAFILPIMRHIVLLGDSVFDNKAYVDGGLDVIEHVRRQIPAGWKASLRAVDGSVVENVRKQLIDLPGDATHLVISGGGHDAILNP